jgi:hypothetical protein
MSYINQQLKHPKKISKFVINLVTHDFSRRNSSADKKKAAKITQEKNEIKTTLGFLLKVNLRELSAT